MDGQRRGEALDTARLLIDSKARAPRIEAEPSRGLPVWACRRILGDGERGALRGAQRRDPGPGSRHLVQAFLLGLVALAPAGDLETERVAVELQALLGVAHDDRRVIDPEEDAIARPLPAGFALPGGELENLERVAVRVLEGERADATG